MKNRLCWIIMVLMFFCIGCQTYSEGDEEAQKSFAVMTTKEKAMHDKVDSEWSQKKLMGLRTAVRKCRMAAPHENQMPFSDVAAMVVFTNDNELVLSDSWGDSTIKRCGAVKFASQDPAWYKTICTIAEINYSERGINHETLLEEGTDTSISVNHLKNYEEKIIEGINKSLLKKEQIDDLAELIRNCEPAQDRFEDIVSYGNPLTQGDAQELEEMVLVCEAQKAKERLED